VIAWLGVGVFVSALLFGEFYRTDPAVSGPLETRLVFLSLLIQSFAFHGGIAVALACVLAAALKRRRLGITLGLAAALLLGPAAWSQLPRGSAPADKSDLVVLSANVLYTNEDPSAFIGLVLDVDPDVVLIQEYRASWSEPLEEALGERYPHRVELPSRGAFGEAVLSKTPFLDTPKRAPEGWEWDNPLILVEIEHDGERIEIGCVHLMAPLSWKAIEVQRRQVAMLGSWAESRVSMDDAPDALILAGDFNAPYRSNHLRELRSAGLREAHDEVGVGRGSTWGPRRGSLSWAPGIRLDQVIYAGEILCTGGGVGSPIGSDHRPVWASLRIGSE